MKFIILGCGSSMGVPRPDGYFGKCDPNNKRNHRTRCSALIQTKTENIIIDTSPDLRQQLIRNNVKRIDKVFSEDENRLIYVYDFLHLWTFFIELVETAEKDALKGYPSLIFSHGEVPETPPEKDFSTEDDMGGGLPAEDDLDEDDYDEDQFY